jgi:hypothetical protein
MPDLIFDDVSITYRTAGRSERGDVGSPDPANRHSR